MLESSSGSEPGFFKIGLTMADLKAAGTTPETREELIAFVMEGLTQSIILQRRGTGMGSAGDELRLLALTNLIISAFDTAWKLARLGGE